MFVFCCVVSNSLYCRVCLFISWGSNFRGVSFLSMIIYEVLYIYRIGIRIGIIITKLSYSLTVTVNTIISV